MLPPEEAVTMVPEAAATTGLFGVELAISIARAPSLARCSAAFCETKPLAGQIRPPVSAPAGRAGPANVTTLNIDARSTPISVILPTARLGIAI